MDDLEANKTLAADFRAIARGDLDQFLSVLETGQTESTQNPFTGEPSIPRVQQQALDIRSKLESGGLLQDEAFMKQFRKAIESLVVLPVFSLATAFDGEGAFKSGNQWQVALDGTVIESAIHDFFYD